MKKIVINSSLAVLLLLTIALWSQDKEDVKPILKKQERSELILNKMTANRLSGIYDETAPFIVVDARAEGFTDGWRLPKAMHLPFNASDNRIKKALPNKDIRIVVYSTNGQCTASTKLVKRLIALGYKEPVILEGGIQNWRKQEYETVKEFKKRK